MDFPPEFVSLTKSLLPEGEFNSFLDSLEKKSPTSVRLNQSKLDSVQYLGPEKGGIAEGSFYLSERPSFTFDPLFHAGCYYVQEASSMFLEQAIRSWVKEPVIALDLCAAPGGKSTHMASLIPTGSLLVSNEVIRTRANILSENIIKWGNPAVMVTNNDPAEIGMINDFFDIIITDVPCSGEGMFRKDKTAITEWSAANVKLCAERQQRIIADIWPSLKPGGLLVYSTCTYNTLENEENIHWIEETFGAETLPIPIESSWNIDQAKKYTSPVYRFWPHRVNGEGFFMAILRKPDTYEKSSAKKTSFKNKGKQSILPEKALTVVHSWLDSPEKFRIIFENGNIFAVPAENLPQVSFLKEKLKCLHYGIRIGEIKGKDIIPGHSLAMSTHLNTNAFPQLEVDKETAITYLRKEALFNLPPDCPKGYVLITYQSKPLGFAKNIGNRANNLYPQEWRIRKN